MSLLQLLRAKFGAAAPVNPPITPVAAGISPGGVLGCGQPVAEIWNRGGTQRVLALPGLTDASWGRILADTSDGSITLAGQAISNDPQCCEVMRTVRPWKHELHIYRDNELQWCGPITEMTADVDSIAIKARDLSAWYDHRLVHETHIYGGQGADQGTTDTTVIFGDLVTDAMAPDTSPNITLDFGIVAGVLAQGNYTPASFKTVGPLIRDLAKGSIDWYCIKRVLSYTGGGANTPSAGTGINVTAASIANPGFDVNTTGWAISGAGPWVLSRDTGIFHTGPGAGKAIGAAGFSSDGVVTTSVTSMQVGKSYTLSGWVRGSGGAVSSYIKTKGTFTIAGVTSADWSYNVMKANPSTWVQINVTFTATAVNHTLTITGNAGPVPAAFYFDDFTLILNNPDTLPPATPTAANATIFLTDDDLATPAKITLSGLDQENRSIVSGQQTGGDVSFYGEAPAPQWVLNTTGPGLTTDQTEYGLLEGATSTPLTDASGAQAQATQRSDILSQTPIVVDSLILGPGAGVTMDQLVPGALISLQLDRSCLEVRQTMLLRQVQVKTSLSGEQVTITLEPAGTA